MEMVDGIFYVWPILPIKTFRYAHMVVFDSSLERFYFFIRQTLKFGVPREGHVFGGNQG
jgi:hypothetical protein